MALSSDTLSAVVQVLSEQSRITDEIKTIKVELERQRQFEENFNLRVSRKEREEVVNFFGKVSPAIRHRTSQSLRHRNTGLWLIEAEEFQDWLACKVSGLWLSGIPGGGKTILASAIIEAAQQQCRDCTRACVFFYCDYKDEQTQNPLNVFSSLLAQLAVQHVEAFRLLQDYYERCRSLSALSRAPELQPLIELFHEMAKQFEVVYVIVDGLDECGDNAINVTEALSSLEGLGLFGRGKLAITLLSRDEVDIRALLIKRFSHIKIAARSIDLQLFVSEEMDRRMNVGDLEIGDASLKDVIMDRLIDRADGM